MSLSYSFMFFFWENIFFLIKKSVTCVIRVFTYVSVSVKKRPISSLFYIVYFDKRPIKKYSNLKTRISNKYKLKARGRENFFFANWFLLKKGKGKRELKFFERFKTYADTNFTSVMFLTIVTFLRDKKFN